jgi:hypothetical protein
MSKAHQRRGAISPSERAASARGRTSRALARLVVDGKVLRDSGRVDGKLGHKPPVGLDARTGDIHLSIKDRRNSRGE